MVNRPSIHTTSKEERSSMLSLHFNPWVAFVLGVLVGWLIQWLLELWYFRKRRLECQHRLSVLEEDLQKREAELLLEREHAASLEADLTALRARMSAEAAPSLQVAASQLEVEALEAGIIAPTAEAEAAAPQVEAELPPIDFDRLGARVEAELPEVAVAAAKLEAGLPEVAVAAPKLEAGLPEVAVAAAKLEAELPEVAVAAPELEAGLPEVAVAAPKLEAELPEVAVAAPTAEVRWPEISAQVAETGAELPEAALPRIGAELPAVSAGLPEAAVEALAPQPAAADDLTLIRGIGPRYAAQLSAAGITSYAALAATQPEQLKAIIAAPQWRKVDYEAWIEEAKLLAAGEPVSRLRASLAEEVTTSCPQDLSRVKGIGSVYEQKLYAAGIGTFWELSQVDDETLARILELKDFQAVDLASIKAQALRLAEETGTVGREWDGTPPDDFEPLQGIGPVYEGRLYDAGICTYRALANATVEQLAEICRAPEWRKPDYASWIAQARRLLGQEG